MGFILDICGEKILRNPSEEDIRKSVFLLDPKINDAFLVLKKTDTTYIQIWTNKKNNFGIEYQSGDMSNHYRCKTMFTAEEIVGILVSYVNENNGWKEKNKWEIVDLPQSGASSAAYKNDYKIKDFKDFSLSAKALIFFPLVLVLLVGISLGYASDGNHTAAQIVQFLKKSVIILAIAFYLESRVFSDPIEFVFNKERFCGLLVFLAIGYVSILYIIKCNPATKVIFTKAGLLLLALWIVWEIRIVLQTGVISGRGFNIYRRRNPCLFWFGILLYLICAGTFVINVITLK